MQTTGNSVGLGVKLAAGVQLSHNHLHRRHARRVHFDRNTTAVIADLNAAVFQQSDLNIGGVTRHRLVDGVVYNLPHQVVQATLTSRANVHTRPLTHGLEALEDGNR